MRIFARRCDIFCAVIDNYGDIGVCWRLARQLHAEHGWRVRLWVDRLEVFQRLCPSLDAHAACQTRSGVTILPWQSAAPGGPVLPTSSRERGAGDLDGAGAPIPDVVIEAFACDLPDRYVRGMARRAPAPVWINLEYLSAENWVAGVHLLPSPHPRYALVKTFFFPGFTCGAGGVLKEAGLDRARHAFQCSPAARAAWWARLGEPMPGADTTVISWFGYETAALDVLLAAWRDGPAPVMLLVPEGRSSPAVARFFGLPALTPGSVGHTGSLRVIALPFTDQAAYDRLLWVCDFNLVRGEDSFVRAQWAERPFAWHIYPQADAAHLPKLDAVLNRYTQHLPPPLGLAVSNFWRAVNAGGQPDWNGLWRYRAPLAAHARAWAAQLARCGDLAANIVTFYEKRLK